MKNINESEIEFIENYYKFFSKKDKMFTNFVIACNLLITTGQISKESLDHFIEKNDSERVINEKTIEYNDLIAKSKKLMKEIDAIKEKFTPKQKEVDPCSHGGSSRRSSC